MASISNNNKKTPIFYLLLFCFLLFASEIAITRVEGALCETPSGRFRGMCFRSSKCRSVCEHEYFSDGYCRGARRRCICSKPC